MRVWRGLQDVGADEVAGRTVVTIGNFDGVHRGHQQVIAHIVTRAREIGAEAVVTTFDPHPMSVIHPDSVPLRLTSLSRRIELLEGLGVGTVLVLPFTREISLWEPDEFVRAVLVDGLNAAEVHVGESFRFGHRAAGTVDTLREAGARHGFVVAAVPLAGDTARWSSTYVRQCLAEGDTIAAAAALGRPHRVEGPVVEGDKRGRELGYPTANLSLDDTVAIPVDGVYAGWLVRADGDTLPAAISIGTNPTFGGTTRRVEAHALDRDDLELYGEHVGVEFADRLRDTLTFDGVEPLVEQMARDVDQARALTATA
ncbi:MAG: bifunctional riboflavin kinase/FAD synthetase [Spirochaetaceae bacterium]|nr:bifunctional riboflavin kinase/FAD synthetase [Spirochaetaceae bacterium]